MMSFPYINFPRHPLHCRSTHLWQLVLKIQLLPTPFLLMHLHFCSIISVLKQSIFTSVFLVLTSRPLVFIQNSHFTIFSCTHIPTPTADHPSCKFLLHISMTITSSIRLKCCSNAGIVWLLHQKHYKCCVRSTNTKQRTWSSKFSSRRSESISGRTTGFILLGKQFHLTTASAILAWTLM